MRQCSICGEIKSENDFFVKRKNQNGSVALNSECKVCHCNREKERYYQKQIFIDSLKKPCIKCGEDRIRCLSFHHNNSDEKEFTIGRLIKSNFDVIKKEIDKCVCLCLNCHHEFHYLNKTNSITLNEYLAL